MKLKKTYLFGIIAAASFMFSCEKDDEVKITPSSISNLSTFELPGQIGLTWEVPADSNYHYLKVSYFDHLLQKDVVRLASVYSDTLIVPDTRAKFGEYSFSVQPYSITNTPGTIQTIKGTSGAAPMVKTITGKAALTTTIDQISTNSQEPSEGPIKNLLDKTPSTYFHTIWSLGNKPWPAWIQVDLGKEVDGFSFDYTNRQNSNGKPSVIEVYASTNGETWKLMETISSGLPSTSGSTYASASIVPADDMKIRYVRITVTKTHDNGGFFNMADLSLNEVFVTIVDPEAE